MKMTDTTTAPDAVATARAVYVKSAGDRAYESGPTWQSHYSTEYSRRADTEAAYAEREAGKEWDHAEWQLRSLMASYVPGDVWDNATEYAIDHFRSWNFSDDLPDALIAAFEVAK
jgi:hypothetical protein